MNINHQAILAILLSGIAVLSGGCNSIQNRPEETQTAIQSDNNLSTVPSADGSLITYDSQGEGETAIVFIHCWTCNHQFWQPQIDHFSKEYKVIGLDLAGHGQSESKRQQYTMQAFGSDVASVVNQVNPEQVILVGHSMGGPVAVEAAKLLGDKVIGIVGVDTFYTGFDYPQSEEKIEEFVAPFKQDFAAASEQLSRSMFTPSTPPEVVNQIVTQMQKDHPEMGVSALYEIFRWNAKNVPSDLNQYANKLKNINGAPTGNETALHESVTLIPNVGHFVAQVKPDEFNQTLEKMIAEYPIKSPE
jgi:pimeloyl-ACP methyl ester carboxylesterase